MPAFKSVDELNKHLETRTYVTEYQLTDDDITAFATLKSLPNPSTQKHAYRWAIHIAALTGKHIGAATDAAPAAAPTSAKKEDDMSLFDDDDDEDEETRAATKARQERMALAKKLKEDKDAASGKVKKDKEKPVEKSLVVLEVKPWEADTDLKMVWGLIKEFQQEGLTWGESYKLEPVAYGIMKLVMTCSIVDSLVLMDDITDKIESLEDYVQSVQVASMNKI
jgi:elongation factor 1-beta